MTKKSINAASKQAKVSEEGLENNVTVIDIPDYTNLEYLKAHADKPQFPAECTSAKWNPEREPKITVGLEIIKAAFPDMSDLFILMCAWWENKTARTTIKKALDQEAIEKGIDPVTYMQVDMKSSADMIQSIKEAADRMSYAVTYYKPRTAIKDSFKQFRIRGKIYNVNLRILGELKEMYAYDKEKLFDEVIKVSQEMVVADEL